MDLFNIGHRNDLGQPQPKHESQAFFCIKLIPVRIRTVYNHMDKLTLTRQFRIQFVIWRNDISRYQEGISM
jgi:hypothetical protein